MGFDINSFFASGVEGIFKGARDLISLWKLDPAIAAKNAQEQAQWAAKLAEMELQLRNAELTLDGTLIQAQNKVNEIEAASEDPFVRRWRPAIGYICGIGLSLTFIIGPFFTWISGWIATGKPGPFPLPPTADLMVLTLGMLGIGGYRTFEKVRGVAR